MRKNGECSGLNKSETRYKWIKRGLKPEQFEYAWEQKEQSTECEWCHNKYKSNSDKQMDHAHEDNEYYEKGNYRNILCQSCNSWRRDNTKFIYYRKSNDIYAIEVFRNGNRVLATTRKIKEEAEACLLKFKEDNPEYFIPDFILV